MDYEYDQNMLIDIFTAESLELLEELEQTILSSEREDAIDASINEIFRTMHTIKGSAATLQFQHISSLAHAMEDIFDYLRSRHVEILDRESLGDILLEGVDFIKAEIGKLQQGQTPDGDASSLIVRIKDFLSALKAVNEEGAAKEPAVKAESSREGPALDPSMGEYRAVLYFEEDTEMVNIRALLALNKLKEIAQIIRFHPSNIEEDGSVEVIRKEGFQIVFRTGAPEGEVKAVFNQIAFLKDMDLELLKGKKDPGKPSSGASNGNAVNVKSERISVEISKLDDLLDLTGELVIAHAMVAQNPELAGLPLEGFYKAVGNLEKIINDLQDTVMSMRMVPLTMTFQRMKRIVRDMSRRLDKEVELEIIGSEIEVDKSVIDHLSDPLMHLIRNALDHGLESAAERERKGKPPVGRVTLEARNEGGNVWIIVRDDGRGLSREEIYRKARERGLTDQRMEELKDSDIYGFILQPGFSTKENVTEFSGRGVGLDVVQKNIQAIGGSISIKSAPDEGTAFSIRIPYTLAIIEGMIVEVGSSSFIIPISSIQECFKGREEDIITDPDGNQMLMIRGECYPVVRLFEEYRLETAATTLDDGIIVVVEKESGKACVLVDHLVGQQQVVVKALPRYIRRVRGITGCTLLGNGDISLILDPAALIDR
ncbi:MAG: chemotaxis protein CheW [Clostridia bacterium]|jgi:two-component system chemotaxis sensor kinase CheA